MTAAALQISSSEARPSKAQTATLQREWIACSLAALWERGLEAVLRAAEWPRAWSARSLSHQVDSIRSIPWDSTPRKPQRTPTREGAQAQMMRTLGCGGGKPFNLDFYGHLDFVHFKTGQQIWKSKPKAEELQELHNMCLSIA
eukprot:2957175-Amphidinium_carterae.2